MKRFLLIALSLATASGIRAQAPAGRPAIAPPALLSNLQARTQANPNFRMLTATLQQFRPNGAAPAAWLDTLRFSYSRFTAANLPLRVLRENAPTRGANLRALRQEYLQYNPAGKLLTDSTITYTNGVLNSYPTLVLTNTYNAQGQLTQEQTSLRVSGTLRPSYRSTYTYDAAGNNTRILDESYFGTSWLYDSQTLKTYNAQGQLTEEELQSADISGTAFSPLFKDIYTYNAAGLRSTDTQQNYNNGAYVTTFVTSLTYTTGPDPQLSTYAVLRMVGTALQPYSRGTNTYDADGNLTEELSQLYNASQSAYVNDTRYVYTYQRVLATAAPRLLGAALAVAPNPSRVSAAATLRYELLKPTSPAIAVLDLTGRTVATVPATPQAAGAHTAILPALPAAGLYLVRLSAAGQSQTLKLVVE